MPPRDAQRDLPTALRVCRSLLWAQAAYMLFTGLFVLLASAVLGGSIPFRDGTVSGAGAVTLGVVYVLAALMLTWIGVALGRGAPWVKAGIASMEVFVAVVQLVRAFDLSLSTAITVVLFVAIMALTFVPAAPPTLEGSTQA